MVDARAALDPGTHPAGVQVGRFLGRFPVETWESVTPAAAVAYGRFIDEQERHGYAGTPLSLVAIRPDFEHRYDGKPSPRWLVDAVALVDGELICPTFGANPTRDRIFAAAAAALESGRVLGPVVMLQTGKSKGSKSAYWVIRSATADELADYPADRIEAIRAQAIADATAEAGGEPDADAGSADELPF